MLRLKMLAVLFAVALMASGSTAMALCSTCQGLQTQIDSLYIELDGVQDDIDDKIDEVDTLSSQKSIAQAVVVSLLQVPPAQRDQQWYDDYDEAIDLLGDISADLYIAEAQLDSLYDNEASIESDICDLELEMNECEVCNP